MFQIKDFASIAASMINWMRGSQDKVTDFAVGSVARTMLEAPAIEIDELYQQMFHGLRESIPVAIYRGFEFPTLGAVAAAGIVRVTIAPISTDTLLSVGTVFRASTDARQYLSLAAVTIPAGQATADIQVMSDSPGAPHNALAGTAFVATPSPLSFVSAVTANGLAGGTDGESDDSKLARFRAFIASLARGTPDSLKYAASTVTLTDATTGAITERVARAYLEETPGHATMFIHNGTAGTSAALVAQVARVIDGYIDPATLLRVPGWRPAGMRVDIAAMTEIAVPVAITVQAVSAAQTDATRNAVRTAIAAIIASTPSGKSLAPLSILTAALQTTGVLGCTLTAPTVLVPCPITAVIYLGTFTLTWQAPA